MNTLHGFKIIPVFPSFCSRFSLFLNPLFPSVMTGDVKQWTHRYRGTLRECT